jgi:predicted nucleic acid-binding protein
MADFVIDASIACAWCFPDERTDYTHSILKTLESDAEAIAPSLWAVEIGNSVLMGMRRKRISLSDAEEFLIAVRDFKVTLFEPPAPHLLFSFAHQHTLTAYDAAYLYLAHEMGLPLATLDRQLIRAAEQLGHPIFVPQQI